MQNRKEYTGSVLRQIQEAKAFFDLDNQTVSIYEDLLQIDVRDDPKTALWQGLLGMAAGRKDAMNAPVLNRIDADRMERMALGPPRLSCPKLSGWEGSDNRFGIQLFHQQQ